VTQGIQEITKPGSVLTILDTKGLELKDYETIKTSIIKTVRARQGEDPNTYVHLAWVCIAESSGRIEAGDVELARELKALGLSVIVVITKATTFKNNSFETEVGKEFRGVADEIILTRGVSEPQYDDDDNITGSRPIRGIDELISQSFRFIPASQRQSFANALAIKNRAGLDAKRAEATKIVTIAAGAAATVGAAPIPFSDAIALVPIQGAMIAKISQVYGLEVGSDIAIPIITALAGMTGTTLIGRTIISSLIKFVPVLGSAAGGAIAATTAATLTKGLGELYISTLENLAQSGELDLQTAIAVMRRKV
jgi:uncharacterized protein (DUF697 family)